MVEQGCAESTPISLIVFGFLRTNHVAIVAPCRLRHPILQIILLRIVYDPELGTGLRNSSGATAAKTCPSRDCDFRIAGKAVETNRVEAFSDGVLAIIITIMVLELKVPQGTEIAVLRPVLPVLLSYVLSFVYVGIYWNNHHHLFHSTRHVSGGILWANLHLLFWLSLFPFATGWVGENHFAPMPTAVYGLVLLMAAIAYYILQQAIIVQQGAGSILAAAVGHDRKGKLSPVFYLLAVPLAFLNPWLAHGIYVFVALLWLIPDRRIERVLRDQARIPL